MDSIPIPETSVRPHNAPRSDNHPFIRAPSPAAHLLHLLSQSSSTSTAQPNGSQPVANTSRSASAPPPDAPASSENLSAPYNILSSTLPQPPPLGTVPVQLPPNTSAPQYASEYIVKRHCPESSKRFPLFRFNLSPICSTTSSSRTYLSFHIYILRQSQSQPTPS